MYDVGPGSWRAKTLGVNQNFWCHAPYNVYSLAIAHAFRGGLKLATPSEVMYPPHMLSSVGTVWK